MLLDFNDKTANERYKLMAQIVIPRPIAWIVSGDEVINIAPFSYFTPLSSEPATIMVSIGHRPDMTPKDTLRNLRKYKKGVICMVNDSKFEQMHYSSKSLDETQSEAEYFDIATKKILDDFPPIVEDVKAALFCEYLQEVDLKGSKTIPVILEVKHLYIDESVISDKDTMSLQLDVIARVGSSYARLGEELDAPIIP